MKNRTTSLFTPVLCGLIGILAGVAAMSFAGLHNTCSTNAEKAQLDSRSLLPSVAGYELPFLHRIEGTLAEHLYEEIKRAEVSGRLPLSGTEFLPLAEDQLAVWSFVAFEPKWLGSVAVYELEELLEIVDLGGEETMTARELLDLVILAEPQSAFITAHPMGIVFYARDRRGATVFSLQAPVSWSPSEFRAVDAKRVVAFINETFDSRVRSRPVK